MDAPHLRSLGSGRIIFPECSVAAGAGIFALTACRTAEGLVDALPDCDIFEVLEQELRLMVARMASGIAAANLFARLK
jgi:hypothetical protein